MGYEIHGRAEVVITVTGLSLQTRLLTEGFRANILFPNIVTASVLR